MSLYWDQDPVYQFDLRGNLRRAFINSQRYSAVDGKLVRLVKQDSRDGGIAPATRIRSADAERFGDQLAGEVAWGLPKKAADAGHLKSAGDLANRGR